MSEEIKLDDRIKKVGGVATKAFVELNKIQTGSKKLIRTGYPMIDDHIGGMLASDVTIISGLPSSGKSETLYRMIDKIMSIEVNPDAEDFVSLEASFEMGMLNKLLRKSHNILNKSKTSILSEKFTEEEAAKIKEYHAALQDDRRFVIEEPMSPEEFYKVARDFCIKYKDKEAIIFSADHALLFVGVDKQKVLEKVTEYINLLRLEFKNCYFLILSQLNRAALSTVKDKNNEMRPNSTHLYGSSFLEHIASYIIIISNPFKQGVQQYLKVSPERYDYLSDFFGDEDSTGKVSFNTIGNIFYFLTKLRESDVFNRDLYIEKMDYTDEQIKKMEDSIESKTPTLKAPTFGPRQTEENPFRDLPQLSPKDDIFDSTSTESTNPPF